MKFSKVLRGIFLICFAATFVLAAVTTAMDLREVKEIQTQLGPKKEKLDRLREQIQSTNLKFRGYMESLKTIPDSTRIAEAGPISATMREYNKTLRNLELDERETARLLRKDERSKTAVYHHLKRRLALYAGAALVFLTGFLVAARRARFRA